MSVHKSDMQQARANMLKTIRAAVRLRHSIAADEELNEILVDAEEWFNHLAQKGKFPEFADIKKHVGL